MRITHLKSTLIVAGFLACINAAPVHADYVWLERDGRDTATAYVGDLDARREPAASVAGPRAYLADGKSLPVSVSTESIAIAAAGHGDVRLAATRVLPQGALQYFHAKIGRAETKAVNDLELVPTTPGGTTFKLVWKGTTVPASQVNVSTSAGWRRVLKPAADGSVTLATPFPALYLLEVSAKINGSVTVEGKTYEDVRHIATLTFEVKD